MLGTLAATNYDFTFAPGKLTVTKATLTVTADDTSREYGAPNGSLTATITGYKNGENARHLRRHREPGVHDHAHGLQPGQRRTGYPITCVLGTLAASNYDFTFAPGKLTVTKATLTVTADDTSREYGAPNGR